MKDENGFLTKSNIKKILLIAFLIIIFFLGLQNITSVGHALGKVWDVVFPFVLGGAIAFIFNVPIRQLETYVFKKPFKGRRLVSYLITLIIVLGLIALAMSVVIPRLVETGKSIARDYSNMGGTLEAVRDRIVARFPASADLLNRLDLSYSALTHYISNFFQGKSRPSLVHSATGVVSSVVNGVASFLIAFAFSIYVLMAKEKLGRQVRQIFYALLPERHADKWMEIGSLTYTTFSNFIRGQFLEACILGSMFLVTMLLLRLPYALLISIVIAITALIPVFGAFLGATIGALLILIQSPKQMIIFLVLFIILQQIEGKLIYPHVVGGKVGLPSVWVLFAITVGAKINGVVGMILFVPLCSVLYALFREFILDRLKKKKISPEKIGDA